MEALSLEILDRKLDVTRQAVYVQRNNAARPLMFIRPRLYDQADIISLEQSAFMVTMPLVTKTH